MTSLQLNTAEESLLIVFTILLLLTMLALLFIVYKKRSLLFSNSKVKEDEKLWHEFIIIDSPDHMIAIKNSESPSFESSRYHRPSTATIGIQHQQQQQHTSSLTNNAIICDYSLSNLPQSPPPVYNQHVEGTTVATAV